MRELVEEKEHYDEPHKSLKVYEWAYAISVEIYKVSSDFPREERFAITDQIRRASSSICANIAEGYGRQMTSNNEFRRFLIISKGSCNEMLVWIDYSQDLNFIPSDLGNKWKKEYIEISKMLFSLINTVERKSRNPQLVPHN